MTRAERAAEKLRKEQEKTADLERKQKEALAEQQVEVRKAEAVLREEMRKADNKKRYRWGAIAQEHALFVWDDADWQAICTVLAHLVDTPNPAAVLEALVSDNGVSLHGAGEFLAEKLYIAPTSQIAVSAQPAGAIFPLPLLETADESD